MLRSVANTKPTALCHATDYCIPDGSYNNYRYSGSFIAWYETIERPARMMLFDVQRTGGLLLAVYPKRTDELLAALQEMNVPMAAIIGEIMPGKAGGYISVTDNN